MLKKNLKVMMAGFLGDHPSHLVAMERDSNACCFLVTPALFFSQPLERTEKGTETMHQPLFVRGKPMLGVSLGVRRYHPLTKRLLGLFSCLNKSLSVTGAQMFVQVFYCRACRY